MRITVNGVEYASWDDVPEKSRRLLEQVLPDTDHNGIPDALEGKAEPGHHTYTARLVATQRKRTTPVPESEGAVGTPASERRILLNGVPVGDDGQPVAKKRWWRRG